MLSTMENGYLGSVILDWTTSRRTYAENRRSLLEHCSRLRLPVTLSSAMLFAHDPLYEHVRINYFMPGRDLELGIMTLMQFQRETCS